MLKKILRELKILSILVLSNVRIKDILISLSDDSTSSDELWLLQSLLRKEDLWPRVREHLVPEEFHNQQFKEIYSLGLL